MFSNTQNNPPQWRVILPQTVVVLRLRNLGIKVKSLVLHVCFLILLLLALNLTSLGISFLNCKINKMILSLPIATIMGQSEQSLVTARTEALGPRAQGKRLSDGGRDWREHSRPSRGPRVALMSLPRGLNYSNILVIGRTLLDLCIPSLPTSQFLHLPDISHGVLGQWLHFS